MLHGADLFVGSGVGKTDALDLRASVSSGAGAAAETWGCVDAANTHVARFHSALFVIRRHTHIRMFLG